MRARALENCIVPKSQDDLGKNEDCTGIQSHQ